MWQKLFLPAKTIIATPFFPWKKTFLFHQPQKPANLGLYVYSKIFGMC